VCQHKHQYHVAIAEADTHITSWSPDAAFGNSQWVALASIPRAIADRLIGYRDDLHHQKCTID
jgi:hypothetical protein